MDCVMEGASRSPSKSQGYLILHEEDALQYAAATKETDQCVTAQRRTNTASVWAIGTR